MKTACTVHVCALYLHTVLAHCTRALCPRTVPAHCTRTLCLHTWMRIAKRKQRKICCSLRDYLNYRDKASLELERVFGLDKQLGLEGQFGLEGQLDLEGQLGLEGQLSLEGQFGLEGHFSILFISSHSNYIINYI